MDEIDFAEPILPYAGTSGWSGSDSSLAAIIAQDKDGRTLTQQRTAFKWVVEAGCFGKTWRELALRTGWHQVQLLAHFLFFIKRVISCA